jgi:hypothetical protein
MGETPEFYDTVSMFIGWFEKGYLKPPMSGEDYFKASSVLVGGFLAPPSKNAEKMTMSSTVGTTIEIGPVRVCGFILIKRSRGAIPWEIMVSTVHLRSRRNQRIPNGSPLSGMGPA